MIYQYIYIYYSTNITHKYNPNPNKNRVRDVFFGCVFVSLRGVDLDRFFCPIVYHRR